MGWEPIKQFERLLSQSKQILILLGQNPSGDAIGSAWALSLFLRKRKVDAIVAVQDKDEYVKRYSFLHAPEQLIDDISGSRDFMLAFNTKHNNIMNIRTEQDEEETRIFITPQKGSIDPRDFSFIPAKFKYDLVIVLDSPDKESLGKVYEENPDIFYEVPVVNIDHHNENDNFGQVNIVDLTSSSTAEILAGIFSNMDPNSLDETIAKCLLTGIIEATNSFQKKNTTPKALQLSAMLMSKGADQQEIIRYLYKTQPFHLLKLWGRIMARLIWEESVQLVWAPVFLDDFVQSRSNPKDIPLILEKIKENYSTGKIFMILYNDTPDTSRGIVKCINHELLKKVAQQLEGTIRGNVCVFEQPIGDVNLCGQQIIEKLKKENIQ